MSDVIEQLEKGKLKLTITKLSDNAPAYVRAREQEIELMELTKLGKQMQWVSVADGLPLPDKMVLCYLKDGVTCTGYHYDCWHTGRLHTYVTHWMPLPPNPIGCEP